MGATSIWTLVLSGIAALSVAGVPIAWWAVRLQRRAERRDLEPRDVVWSASRFDKESGWSFQHSGTTDATNVKIDLSIDGRTSTARFDRVAPDHPVEVKHAWHNDLIEFTEAQDRRYERERDAFSGEVDVKFPVGSIKMPAFMQVPMPIPPLPHRVEATFVATWSSPLGMPDRQQQAWTETY